MAGTSPGALIPSRSEGFHHCQFRASASGIRGRIRDTLSVTESTGPESSREVDCRLSHPIGLKSGTSPRLIPNLAAAPQRHRVSRVGI